MATTSSDVADMAESDSQTLNLRGMDCAVHTWNASTENPRGVVVVYHGFLAHGRYTTVRYAAELLAETKNNYTVIAVDLPGHGKSPGLRGYLPSADLLVQDGVAIAQYAEQLNNGKVPLFLVGSSMGGTLALAATQHLGDTLAGIVLLAPMLALDVAEPLRYLLKGLSFILPTVALIPSSATSSEKQYRDPDKRRECDEDELTVQGAKLRVASASTCVELASQTRTNFENITCPFLCMIANEDVVVDNAGALELMEKAPSENKTLKRYDALHGLLCEPPPLIDQIHSDVVAWMNEQSASWHKEHNT